MIKYLLLLFAGLFFIIRSPVYAGRDFESSILNYLNGKDSLKKIGVTESDPYYPPYVISKFVKDSNSMSSNDIISKLEDLLLHHSFSGEKSKSSIGRKEFFVGTMNSFKLWREAIYITLARAYYESGDLAKAIFYYRGIPANSHFSSISYLELAWALLKKNDLLATEKVIALFETNIIKTRNDYLTNEFHLIKMFWLVKTFKFNKALSYEAKNNIRLDTELVDLKYKILAQAYFARYIDTSLKLTFKQKIGDLNNIIKFSEKVNLNKRDSEFSFLAGEAYWHKASVYRIEDPVKHEKEWKSYLDHADLWVKVWVNKSIKENVPYLTEEGLFFSTAILWEQEKYVEGIKRLKALPRLFPQGKYKEDTYQMLADYYYDQNNFKIALLYYRQLAKVAGVEKATYGVYKAAWSFYNSGDKWSALRHFERLFLYYRDKQHFGDKATGKVGLKREARQDLLLLMAELLPSKKALNEFKMFKFSKDELIKITYDLAKKYNDLGLYQQSINTWNHMLSEYAGHSQSLNWLTQIILTYFNSGDRIQVAEAINRYFPRLNKNSDDFEKGSYSIFLKELSKVILSIHKEARKSDDQKIWEATDSLYATYINLFGREEDGKLWYFGAQRKERLNKNWEAINWYKRAAVAKNFKNSEDAASSVLQLVGRQIENLSLKPLITKKEQLTYEKLSAHAKWYIDVYPKGREVTIAEFMYIESLYNSGKENESNLFVSNLFTKGRNINDHWNQFLEQNKRLYSGKKWKKTHDLSEKIIVLATNLSESQKKTLYNIYYESAFQQGFFLESIKDGDHLQAISWYEKVAQIIEKDYYDKKLALKSWNNRLLLLNRSNEYDLFSKHFDRFIKGDWKKIEKSSYEERELLFNIFKTASSVYKQLGQNIFQAKYLSLASIFTDDFSTQESMIFDSLVLYGSYYQYDDFNEQISKLNKMSSILLKEKKGVVAIARLMFYNKKFKDSWHLLKSTLLSNKLSIKQSILLTDLFFHTKNNGDLHNEILALLKEKEIVWKNVNSMKPIWSFLYNEALQEKLITWVLPKKDREIASANEEEVKSRTQQERVDSLKERVRNVGEVLVSLENVKMKINKSIKYWQPQNAVESLCQAPVATKSAIFSLNQLINPPIFLRQWSEFLEKLNTKLIELNAIVKTEEESCDTAKINIAFLPGLKNPLLECDHSSCLPFKFDIPGGKEIYELEKKFVEDKFSNVEIVYSYLKIGAIARAKYMVLNLENSEEKIFLLGVIRVSQGDTFNSSVMFKAIKKNELLKAHASFFISYFTSLNKNNSLAKFVKLKKEHLNSWQTEIYNKISSKL